MGFLTSTGRAALPTPLTPSMPTCPAPVSEPIPTLPMTPPEHGEGILGNPDASAIKLALHVISTERAALSHLENLYQNDAFARNSLARAVTVIARSCREHGKLVVCGVGKSGKIGAKLVATCNSLGIMAIELAPTDALHGDLGIIKPNDVVLMITFSGRTPELQLLLPHISTSIPLIVLTSHVAPSTCPLIADRENSILLPAPIHEPENVSFGLAAPTTSTTVALALGDALSLSVAERLHTIPGRSPADVFRSYHPGGAIGLAASTPPTPRMSDLATPIDSVPIVSAKDGTKIRSLDILRSAVRSPGGWVRVSPYHMLAPRRVQQLQDMDEAITDYIDDSIVVERTDFISVLGDCTIEEARQWISKMRSEERGKTFLHPGTILGIVDKRNEVSGVVEIEEVVGDDWSVH